MENLLKFKNNPQTRQLSWSNYLANKLSIPHS